MPGKQTLYLALGALVITLIIRLTVFTDDCNLLIVAVTFIAAFSLLSLLKYTIRKLRS